VQLQRVLRLHDENLCDDCIQKTTQGGGGSVMVWAGIYHGGKTPLVVLDGNINAVVYRDNIKSLSVSIWFVVRQSVQHAQILIIHCL
uniref:Uncharacterized protein n=1 Tax=Dicentrarchus labrax TaxID=13489 RepID=A0A8C4H6U2_DICLA